MNIEDIALSDYIEPPYNPRKNLKPGDDEFEKLARSFDEFGPLEPIVVNKRTKHVVGGNQRVKVMKQKGMTHTKAVVVDFDLEKEKAASVALNKIRGDWDQEKLASLFDELSSIPDFDVTITGFNLPEISELIDGTRLPPIDDFDDDVAADAITDPVTKRGDVLRLNGHVLMCGDSASPEDLKILMGTDLADLYNTDISYNVAYGKKNNRPKSSDESAKKRSSKQIQNDDLPQEQYETWMRSVFMAVNPHIRPGAAIYIWQGHRQIPPMYQILLDQGFHISSLVCWLKETPTISYADYAFRTEHALYGWKLGAPHYWAGPPCTSNVFEARRDHEYQHPTQKPVELSVKAITHSSKRGDIVFDSFIGGGGLLLACESLGRKCRGMDIDPRYIDVSIIRYGNFVGWDKMPAELRDRYYKESSK